MRGRRTRNAEASEKLPGAERLSLLSIYRAVNQSIYSPDHKTFSPGRAATLENSRRKGRRAHYSAPTLSRIFPPSIRPCLALAARKFPAPSRRRRIFIRGKNSPDLRRDKHAIGAPGLSAAAPGQTYKCINNRAGEDASRRGHLCTQFTAESRPRDGFRAGVSPPAAVTLCRGGGLDGWRRREPRRAIFAYRAPTR